MRNEASRLWIVLGVCLAAGALWLAGCSGRSGEEWTNPKDGQQMVRIPAGEFIMGSDTGSANLKPAHTVYLDAYSIGKTPVTVAQYRAFCAATGRAMPEAPSWGWKETHPIVNVSWKDAKAYCDWAGLALPTEAQWEKAARGTDGRVYPWGNDWDPAKAVCSHKSLRDAGSTAPVGSKPAGASPYGCLDMAGNVWQWCADWYYRGYYASAPERNPTGPESGEYRSLRGASWILNGAGFFRAAGRGGSLPADRGDFFGFRVVSRQDSP